MAPLDIGTPVIDEDYKTKRFAGVRRDYSEADVAKLRGSFRIEHTIAKLGAQRLWELLHKRDYVNALGATTGNQAIFADDGSVEVTGTVLFVEAADVNDDGFNDLVTVNDFTNTRARGLPSERSVRVLLNTRRLHTNVGDRKVHSAPFYVLMGARMPAILVECGFITNERDLARMKNGNYQAALAQGIAEGVRAYFRDF